MKFKNIKKEAKKTEFPSNSRRLTEHSKFSFPKINSVKLLKLYGSVLKIFAAFIFIVAVVVVGYDLRKNLQIKQSIDFQRGILTKDLNFWEDFISKHQNYPDAYFHASSLEYKLGNMSKAKIYVEKGLVLYPNSENGRKLEKLLANK